MIAKGAFGNVVRVQRGADKITYAMKVAANFIDSCSSCFDHQASYFHRRDLIYSSTDIIHATCKATLLDSKLAWCMRSW